MITPSPSSTPTVGYCSPTFLVVPSVNLLAELQGPAPGVSVTAFAGLAAASEIAHYDERRARGAVSGPWVQHLVNTEMASRDERITELETALLRIKTLATGQEGGAHGMIYRVAHHTLRDPTS